MPKQGSPIQVEAASLNNKQLAQRLDMLADRPRALPAEERMAFLQEAAKRLLWPDTYDKHK